MPTRHRTTSGGRISHVGCPEPKVVKRGHSIVHSRGVYMSIMPIKPYLHKVVQDQIDTKYITKE